MKQLHNLVIAGQGRTNKNIRNISTRSSGEQTFRLNGYQHE